MDKNGYFNNNKFSRPTISTYSYTISYSKGKPLIEVPFSWIFSVVLGLNDPPIKESPEGEGQMEW